MIKFPNEIIVAYAVCGKKCGNKEFIVSGGTQVCKSCGNQMFRTEEKKYYLTDQELPLVKNKIKECDDNVELRYDYNLADYPDIIPNSINFPDEITITYVACSTKCGCSEFIVQNQSNICEYCGCNMHAIKSMKYVLDKKTNDM